MARKKTNGDVRFARVPSGSETCPFCLMLASRGFVYRNAKIAGESNHYHPHCDCVIVPSWNGTKVEGYDPDALYDEYVEMLRDGRLNYSKLTKSGGDTSHVLHLSSDMFGSVGDFSRFIDEANDIVDLQRRCAIVEQEFPKSGLSSKYYDMIRNTVQRKKRELIVGGNDTGAIKGALNDANDPYMKKRDAHAKSFYEEVRKRNKKSEVEAISKSSGMDTEEISRVYDHLFVNKHSLDKGVSRFDPSYDIAESWRRLREGKNIESHDITLLKHELLEERLMSQGLSYDEAHKVAEKKYNYGREVEDFNKGK